jgi:hypothetical protein
MMTFLLACVSSLSLLRRCLWCVYYERCVRGHTNKRTRPSIIVLSLFQPLDLMFFISCCRSLPLRTPKLKEPVVKLESPAVRIYVQRLLLLGSPNYLFLSSLPPGTAKPKPPRQMPPCKTTPGSSLRRSMRTTMKI